MYRKVKCLLAVTATASIISFSLPKPILGTLKIHNEQFLDGSYETSEGKRPYKLFVPKGYTGKDIPLVVVLHGCGQDPDNIATGTRFNSLANAYNFLVLYPQQTQKFNAQKCWNWFEQDHQKRGSGEPAIIAGMVDKVKQNYSVNNNNVFITGMSAGGAMAAIMGSCYPDYFAAIGIHSGLHYKSATNLETALKTLKSGGLDPNKHGELAYQCASSSSRPLPVIVFQGTDDSRVAPINGKQVVEQFAKFNDFADDGIDNNSISSVPSSTRTYQVRGNYSYAITTYTSNDPPLIEYIEVYGMGHAWSGGNIEKPASSTDPKGPDASVLMWLFFQEHKKN